MKKVRLAVTGLRQSGKTVFLTSLIGYLLGGGTRQSDLFRRHGVSITAKKLPVSGIEGRFSVEKYMNDFRYEPPKWPERTQEMSEFHLLLQVRNQRWVKEVKLELVDYPGERIVDLPMADKGFEAWSDEMSVEATVGVRAALSGAWRAKCDSLVAGGEAKEVVAAYREYLVGCKGKGLHFLQPSMMLLDLAGGGAQVGFCPLPKKVREAKPLVAEDFARQYEGYKQRYLGDFGREVVRCSHQIVLVDVLDILKKGVDVYNDAKKCFDCLLDIYRYKKRYHWLVDLVAGLVWNRGRVSRVAFVATKADQATRANRNNMKALVEELVCDKYEYLKYDTRSKVGFFYAAANRSTQDKIKEYNGRELSVLLGRHAESHPKEERLYYPGEVPGEWPEDWDPQEQAYRFPDFLPRLLPGREGAVFEDINLDEVVWYIFGEKK